MEGISWDSLVDFAYLSLFLLIATVIRSRVVFIQRILIPSNIIAGVLGLFLGHHLFEVLDPASLGNYVYHLLTAAYIAMGLRGSNVRRGYGAVTTMTIHCQIFAVQGLLGLLFTLFLILTYFPHLFPSFGVQLVMGFGQNPGVAYSLGKTWEPMGFIGGGQVGLAFAAIGFLFAYGFGIILINWGVRRNKTALFKGYDQIPPSVFKGIVGRGEKKKEAGQLTTASEAIDTLTLQAALIGLVFLVTYLFITVVTGALAGLGDTGKDFARLIGGFAFVFGAIFAVVAHLLLKRLRMDHIVDRGLMTRLSGLFIDFMVCAAISAISFTMIRAYWKEILILAIIGGFVTLVLAYVLSNRMHLDHRFERMLASFGLVTGTVTSGLALLRVVDADFATPVAEDLVYAGGMALFFALPLLLVANVPALGYPDQSTEMIIRAVIFITAYIVILSLLWKIYRIIHMRHEKQR
ncbi:MAG: sodium:glutamate symporter [Thermodesulfobacteriota bacterium]